MKQKTMLFRVCISIYLLLLPAIEICGQEVAFSYKGSWSDWRKTPGGNIQRYNDYSGLTLKTNGGIVYFDFKITNYVPPTKDEIKKHKKSNTWYEYKGTVSYYVSDQYPNAEALAKDNTLIMPDPREDKTPRVKRTATATIKIAPYDIHPECYNIWFDDIGVGFSISGLTWEGDKKHKKHRGGKIAGVVILSTLLFPFGLASIAML